MSRVPYADTVGCLTYGMVSSLYQTENCASYQDFQQVYDSTQDRTLVKIEEDFFYLRETTNVGLVYENGKECLMTEYSNFDYAVYVDTRRSVIGYVFTIGSSLRIFKSTLYSLVTSTTEAEYMAFNFKS